MKKSLRLFRRMQMITSAVLFLIIFAICYKVTKFKITEIPLSQWGVTNSVSWLWNGCLFCLGISCYFNIHQYLQSHPHLQFKAHFKYAFLVQCVSMSLLGIFVKGQLIHNILAYSYFFGIPLIIFLLAALNRKRLTFNDWLTNTVLSSFMIVIPLATLFIFKGKAIAEFSHSILFLVWNLYILKEFKNDEIINL